MPTHHPEPSPICRQCGSADLDDWGGIPDASVFAGQPLLNPLPGGRLWHCRACGLGQRQPVLAPEAYETLYAAAPADVWVAGALRADQRLVLERLRQSMPGGSVLDLGCYDGRLLAELGASHQRFGIEASEAAAARAAGRGITMIGRRFDDLRAWPARFDAILAVDVIEHVHRPHALLADLACALRPGGLLLVSTGAIDAEAWRPLGGAYWYCAFPEHISFVGPAWAAAAAPTAGLRLVEAVRFPYGVVEGDAMRARRRFARRQTRVRLARALGRVAPALEERLAGRVVAGVPGLHEDHVLLHFDKPEAGPAVR